MNDEKRCPDEHNGLPGEAQNLNDITKQIIGCSYSVFNALGHGFLEKVYENALVVEMRSQGLRVAQQVPYKVMYRGVPVGDYVADLVVEDAVIVELKAANALDPIHVAQCINYLKASGLKLCLLLNFSSGGVEPRRIIR